MVVFATEHKDVGKDLPVLVFVNPRRVEFLNIFHSIDSEGFIHSRCQFVAADILIVIHHIERLHDSVLDGMAVGTGVADDSYHTLVLYGSSEDIHIGGKLLLSGAVEKDREVVGTVDLMPELIQHFIAVACHQEKIVDGAHLRIGELDGFQQTAEEGRAAVDVVLVGLLEEYEAGSFQEVYQIVQVTPRHFHLVAKFLNGVASCIGEQEDELELFFQFVETHN